MFRNGLGGSARGLLRHDAGDRQRERPLRIPTGDIDAERGAVTVHDLLAGGQPAFQQPGRAREIAPVAGRRLVRPAVTFLAVDLPAALPVRTILVLPSRGLEWKSTCAAHPPSEGCPGPRKYGSS